MTENFGTVPNERAEQLLGYRSDHDSASLVIRVGFLQSGYPSPHGTASELPAREHGRSERWGY